MQPLPRCNIFHLLAFKRGAQSLLSLPCIRIRRKRGGAEEETSEAESSDTSSSSSDEELIDAARAGLPAQGRTDQRMNIGLEVFKAL